MELVEEKLNYPPQTEISSNFYVLYIAFVENSVFFYHLSVINTTLHSRKKINY